MSKTYALLGVTLVSLFVISGPTRVEADSVGGGILQFRAGFENGVQYDDGRLIGGDGALGALESNWRDLGNVLPWLQAQNDLLHGGSIQISEDPTDPANRVLHLHNFMPGAYRSQYSLLQVPAGKWDQLYGPNLFDKQFYRFRIYIPSDITTVVPDSATNRSPFYNLWESHSWDFEPVRHTINIVKLPGSSVWTFSIKQQQMEEPRYDIHEIEGVVEVPFDRWFTLEVFFKYHPTDGEFYVGILDSDGERQIAARIQGQTQFGEKGRTQTVFKLYHSATYTDLLLAAGGDGTHQYYDDFEIWSDYPSGYWRMPAPTNLIISLE